MKILQALIGLIFTTAFFILLFLVAWYIALPLLLILLVVGALGGLRARYAIYRARKSATPLHLSIRKRTPKKGDEVIDVDFTEV